MRVEDDRNNEAVGACRTICATVRMARSVEVSLDQKYGIVMLFLSLHLASPQAVLLITYVEALGACTCVHLSSESGFPSYRISRMSCPRCSDTLDVDACGKGPANMTQKTPVFPPTVLAALKYTYATS